MIASTPDTASQTATQEPAPRSQLLHVTPALAARWLRDSNVRNRGLSMGYAERLAREIREGRWQLTHEGIAFSPGNVLLDGQHRLQAIVLADQPVWMYVWYNVPQESLLAINNGRSRTVTDALNLRGQCGEVERDEISVLRQMLRGRCGVKTLSPGEAQTELLRHREAIAFALQNLSNGIPGIATATTRAVVARAWYSEDRNRLAEFCGVLRTGLVTHATDTPARHLFEYLIRSRGKDARLLSERYGKIERALWAFLRHEVPAKLYTAVDELFPLPEESKR